MLLLLNSSLNGVFINYRQSCNIRREENPKSNIFTCTSPRLMPWHDDIIQLKGRGMKKLFPDGKSVHCTHPCWSPWRRSGNLTAWIHPEGPLNSTWLSWRGHTGPSQRSMCTPRWNPQQYWGLICPSLPLPPALPSIHPIHSFPTRDFYPNGWKGEASAQDWPGCFLPRFPVLWEQVRGLSSTSGYLLATLSDNKYVFNVTPIEPCPVMPWTQPRLFKADLFFLSHTDYMVQTNSPGRHLDFNRDKFRAKQNKSLSYDAENLCQASTQD